MDTASVSKKSLREENLSKMAVKKKKKKKSRIVL